MLVISITGLIMIIWFRYEYKSAIRLHQKKEAERLLRVIEGNEIINKILEATV